MENPFPIDDVRLVFRPEGSDEDVIVRYIERGEQTHWAEREPFSSLPEYPRYIAGTDIEIPWPAELVPDQERYPSDTPREPVDDPSYMPYVLSAPFNDSIVDELVPKHKKNKLRHEDNYVIGKIIEDARSAWYDSRKLQSPMAQKMEQVVKERHEEIERLRAEKEQQQEAEKAQAAIDRKLRALGVEDVPEEAVLNARP
jgi:large subunit ribosomal protein L24